MKCFSNRRKNWAVCLLMKWFSLCPYQILLVTLVDQLWRIPILLPWCMDVQLLRLCWCLSWLFIHGTCYNFVLHLFLFLCSALSSWFRVLWCNWNWRRLVWWTELIILCHQHIHNLKYQRQHQTILRETQWVGNMWICNISTFNYIFLADFVWHHTLHTYYQPPCRDSIYSYSPYIFVCLGHL